MARSRRRKRRGGESVSTWLIAAGLVAAAVVSVYVVVTSPDPVQYDAETLCPEDERLITHHEVLLFERNRRRDAKTREFIPLPPNTALEIRRQIETRLQDLPIYALVEIYEVSYDDSKQFAPVAGFCNPGDGSHISEWTGNPNLAKQRYLEMFRKRFQDVVKRLSSWNPDYRYNLMDSLGGVTRLVLGNPKFEHAAKSLTVVSDFVVPENFARPGRLPKSFAQVDLSMKLGNFEDFANAGGARYDFRGAAVRMILNRFLYSSIPNIQGPAHTAWWERFFNSQNAIVEEVVQVGE